MRLLRFLFFRRRRRTEPAPIREQDAYARSYGERTGEVFGVVRKPEEPPAAEEPSAEPRAETKPEPAAEAEPDLAAEATPKPEPDSVRGRNGGMTGELLRRAFEAKLDARGRTAT